MSASPSDAQPVVHAIHENPDWFGPSADAFRERGIPYREWLLTDGGAVDLDEPPPPGVYWSRFSASSHTRGHALAKEHTRAVLAWAAAAGRRVVNGRSALEAEVSKVVQLATLRRHGLEVPRTTAVVGTADLLAAARGLVARTGGPFLTKHNQGGKGLGVARFDDVGAFAAALAAGDVPTPVDGVTLLQEYVPPADGTITRVELVAGELVYAIRADTVHGGFQLCPADACALDPLTGAPLLPPGAQLAPVPGQSLFSLDAEFGTRPGEDALLAGYRAVLAELGVEIAGVEHLRAADGRVLTYDVNTNTNYNAEVEAVAPRSGPGAIADHLGALLRAEVARSAVGHAGVAPPAGR
ncbi:alpha-L-glutamate ligase [Miniimonas arenae]|uniref:Alpha-L-glutamate ligase n=1 Tax=Miniimonas arenae TaxID=676201 RepID=A0A5C5BF88_9MICO|nr:alpha-L-glutamate ligase [Miniimonas arenae]TNU76250.1 alpha-L-glutamate ligase [Miniimonas arenae]